MSVRPICLRWQDVHGRRLAFSCECAGEGCPDDPRRDAEGLQRLAVNINADCADALRRIKTARGITTTEAIRRAISLLDHFEKSRSRAAPPCGNCAHPIAWHDTEEDDMCAKSECYCQRPTGRDDS